MVVEIINLGIKLVENVIWNSQKYLWTMNYKLATFSHYNFKSKYEKFSNWNHIRTAAIPNN